MINSYYYSGYCNTDSPKKVISQETCIRSTENHNHITRYQYLANTVAMIFQDHITC